MCSILYEVSNKTAIPTNPSAFVSVLADNHIQAVSLAQDFLFDMTGEHLHRVELGVRTLDASLENATWRVLVDGELYHPGAFVGILSEYANATRYEGEE